ncbi:hypothetical protein D3C85_1540650 [compost metagenome]
MDVDLARLVLRNCTVIGQGEGVLLVIGGPDLGSREPNNSGHKRGLDRFTLRTNRSDVLGHGLLST